MQVKHVSIKFIMPLVSFMQVQALRLDAFIVELASFTWEHDAYKASPIS